MTLGFHALAMSFAMCSLLNACMQTSDASQADERTPAYAQDRRFTGWSMMSAQERSELRTELLSMKSYEECANYLEHHYHEMLDRAQKNGSTRPVNRTDICHRMKSVGMFR